MKLRKGDTVEVVTGKDKGKQGEVDQFFPKSNKIIVHGVNTASKHSKPSRANEQGGIIEKDLPFNAANYMFVHGGQTMRLGYKEKDAGPKVHTARPGGNAC